MPTLVLVLLNVSEAAVKTATSLAPAEMARSKPCPGPDAVGIVIMVDS